MSSASILTFPDGAAVAPRTSRYEQGDTYHWRRANWQAKGGTCPKCLGKGWVPAYRYCEYDDFVACPLCEPVTARTDYPADDDRFQEIPF